MHPDWPIGLSHLDKAMRITPAVQKKPASVVKKKPAVGMRKKCTCVVHQKGMHVDLTSCRIRQYNANTKAIKDAYDVVNFERVP